MVKIDRESIINSIDIFGQPIGLSHKGQAQYKTGLGAICTVIIATVISLYVILTLMIVMPDTLRDAHTEVVSSV